MLTIKSMISKAVKYFVIAFAIFYFLPFIILGKNSYFTIHDNLDSEIEYLNVLKISNTMYSDGKTIVPNTFNGIPRAAFKTGLNLTSFLFYKIPIHWAYIINFIFSHTIAFFGMYLLLSKHFVKDKAQLPIVIVCSFLFSILPFYSIYCLTTAGQPLFWFALLNLRSNIWKVWHNYFILASLPFFLLGYLISPFLIITSGIFFMADLLKNKKINFKLIIGISIFLVFTIIVDYQMYNMVLAKTSFVPHRTEWNMAKINNLNTEYIIQSVITLFFKTQYHTGSMPTKIILVLFFIGISISFFNRKYIKTYLTLFLAILCIVTFFGLNFILVMKFGDRISLLRIFQWNRFYYLLPVLWILLLAVLVRHLSEHKILHFFLVFMLSFQFVYIFRENTELLNNWKLILNQKITEPIFSEFYSEPIFKEVDAYIAKPKSEFRVGCVGFLPAVASYNGFYTVDGYQNMYDVNYKHKFRKIIDKDLEKNEAIKTSFDYWGNKCYLYCDELFKNGTISILNFDFNTFKKLGGEYLLTTCEIKYPDSCGLVFNKKFEDHSKGYYKIFLYKVK